MNYQKIKKLQKKFRLDEMQRLINNGQIWHFEGYVGRKAMDLLESGACMLPKKTYYDHYGNKIPSRDMLINGTKGTYQNSVRFWQNVEDGVIEYLEYLAEL